MGLTTGLALGFAPLLAPGGRLRFTVRTLLILPFAMSPALVGVSFRFMFNPEFGLFDAFFGILLPPLADIGWLSGAVLAFAVCVMADVWGWVPFMTLVLIGGLAAVPSDAETGEGSFAAEVYACELTGESVLVTVEVAGRRIAAKAERHTQLGIGETVGIRVDPAHVQEATYGVSSTRRPATASPPDTSWGLDLCPPGGRAPHGGVLAPGLQRNVPEADDSDRRHIGKRRQVGSPGSSVAAAARLSSTALDLGRALRPAAITSYTGEDFAGARRHDGNRSMGIGTHEPATRVTQRQLDRLCQEVLPQQGRWAEDAYLWLTDQTNRLIELTDGNIDVLPVPTDEHQSFVAFLYEAFTAFLRERGGKALFAPLRLRVREGKFREPDLLLVLDARDPRRRSRFWLGADVVVEVVSPDQPERDLVEKRADYAEAGIPEYWIVDPRVDAITVFELEGGVYVEHGVFFLGMQAESALLEGFSVDVGTVFDAAK